MTQKLLAKDIIIVDNREFSSGVTKELSKLGAKIQPHQLEVGDYILSDRVAVERKTSSDFVGSVFNGRLFSQLKDLKEHFEKPILIIEGKDIFTQRNAHPNSLRGALASIAIDYAIPILWTDSSKETAALLYWIAKREKEEGSSISIRGKRSSMSFHELQEYLMAGLPGVNTKRSKSLLERFGNPDKVFKASEEELSETEGIGKKTAKSIREILDKPYEDI